MQGTHMSGKDKKIIKNKASQKDDRVANINGVHIKGYCKRRKS